MCSAFHSRQNKRLQERLKNNVISISCTRELMDELRAWRFLQSLSLKPACRASRCDTKKAEKTFRKIHAEQCKFAIRLAIAHPIEVAVRMQSSAVDHRHFKSAFPIVVPAATLCVS